MVGDFGSIDGVETMAISKFKATCLAALERVHRTGQTRRVTRFGKPIADIVAPSPERPPSEWLGSLRGSVEIQGDIVAPTSDLVTWETADHRLLRGKGYRTLANR